MPGFSGLSNHNCDRSCRDFEPCDFLISAIDFSRHLSCGGKISRINGPARTTKSLTSIHRNEDCSAAAPNSQFHALSSLVRHKSVVNAALQNGEVIRRIKMALT